MKNSVDSRGGDVLIAGCVSFMNHRSSDKGFRRCNLDLNFEERRFWSNLIKSTDTDTSGLGNASGFREPNTSFNRFRLAVGLLD
jgi:hypothetical protein